MICLEKAPRQEPRVKHNLTCDNCIYEPSTDAGKYVMVSKDGKLRIRLELVALTIYTCPKCSKQFLDKNFTLRDSRREAKKAEKSRQHVEQLKSIYG